MNKELPTKRKGLEKLLLSLLITKIFLRHKYKNTIAYFASTSEVNIYQVCYLVKRRNIKN
jgi:hypothetical protein